MNFQRIPPVETSVEMLDVAFRRAREKVKTKTTYPKDVLQKARIQEQLRIDVVRDNLMARLEKILATFPGTITLPEFYQKLIKLTLDYTTFKEAFGAVNWAQEKVKKLHGQFVSKIRRSEEVSVVKGLSKQYYGRVSSVLKQIDSKLKFLEESRKIMKTYPDIKELFTVCIYGFPNVGKSTLLNKLTGTKAKTAPYSFTTVTINVGYFMVGDTEVQVLDVPGTLDRDKHNNVELQAELVLDELAKVIIYVYDVSEQCGYSLENQRQLRKKLGKNVLVYLSKKDLISEEQIDDFNEKHYSLDEIKEKIATLV